MLGIITPSDKHYVYVPDLPFTPTTPCTLQCDTTIVRSPVDPDDMYFFSSTSFGPIGKAVMWNKFISEIEEHFASNGEKIVDLTATPGVAVVIGNLGTVAIASSFVGVSFGVAYGAKSLGFYNGVVAYYKPINNTTGVIRFGAEYESGRVYFRTTPAFSSLGPSVAWGCRPEMGIFYLTSTEIRRVDEVFSVLYETSAGLDDFFGCYNGDTLVYISEGESTAHIWTYDPLTGNLTHSTMPVNVPSDFRGSGRVISCCNPIVTLTGHRFELQTTYFYSGYTYLYRVRKVAISGTQCYSPLISGDYIGAYRIKAVPAPQFLSMSESDPAFLFSQKESEIVADLQWGVDNDTIVVYDVTTRAVSRTYNIPFSIGNVATSLDSDGVVINDASTITHVDNTSTTRWYRPIRLSRYGYTYEVLYDYDQTFIRRIDDNGVEIWRKSVPYANERGWTITPDGNWLGQIGGTITLLSAQDGTELATSSVMIDDAVAVRYNPILIGTTGTTLYIFNNSVEPQTFTPPQEIWPRATTADWHFFVADGNLIVYIDTTDPANPVVNVYPATFDLGTIVDVAFICTTDNYVWVATRFPFELLRVDQTGSYTVIRDNILYPRCIGFSSHIALLTDLPTGDVPSALLFDENGAEVAPPSWLVALGTLPVRVVHWEPNTVWLDGKIVNL